MAKSVAANQRKENPIVRYLRETWFELKKVSWPTRSEAVNLTIIVIIVGTFMAIVLSLLDWVFSTVFRLILG